MPEQLYKLLEECGFTTVEISRAQERGLMNACPGCGDTNAEHVMRQLDDLAKAIMEAKPILNSIIEAKASTKN